MFGITILTVKLDLYIQHRRICAFVVRYQTLYQVGVLVSRSSLWCVKIRKLWALSLLQVKEPYHISHVLGHPGSLVMIRPRILPLEYLESHWRQRVRCLVSLGAGRFQNSVKILTSCLHWRALSPMSWSGQ